jgi:hypothetical protein
MLEAFFEIAANTTKIAANTTKIAANTTFDPKSPLTQFSTQNRLQIVSILDIH